MLDGYNEVRLLWICRTSEVRNDKQNSIEVALSHGYIIYIYIHMVMVMVNLVLISVIYTKKHAKGL